MFGWLKRLFSHTAETPPRIEPLYPPAGLDRPDTAEMVLPVQRVEVPASDPEPVAPGPSRTADARPASAARQPFGASIDDDIYGLTFTIEYQAADGEVSRRRIMLRTISQRDDGATFLQALCFERNALRSFRLDRVIRVIDGDGEVFEDPRAFLRDELRVRLPEGASAPAPRATPLRANDPVPSPAIRPEEAPGTAQRRCARDGLRVLVALARSDGQLHPAEVVVVLDYIGETCRRFGIGCGDQDREALGAYLRRQRPGLDVLEGCLDRLDAASAEEKALLLDFADRLIDADGERHEAEHRLVSEVRAAIAA